MDEQQITAPLDELPAEQDPTADEAPEIRSSTADEFSENQNSEEVPEKQNPTADEIPEILSSTTDEIPEILSSTADDTSENSSAKESPESQNSNETPETQHLTANDRSETQNPDELPETQNSSVEEIPENKNSDEIPETENLTTDGMPAFQNPAESPEILNSSLEKSPEIQNPNKTLEIQHSTECRLFDLNIDCFRELFEFLPLKEICSLRQTCKNLKEITDHCIDLDYPAVKLGHGQIEISDKSSDQLNLIEPNDFKFIKRVQISMKKLKKSKIPNFQSILHHVEMVELNVSKTDCDFHTNFMKFCANIKSLRIYNIRSKSIIKGGESKWLNHHYPTLEHIFLNDLHMKIYCGKEISGLKKFFQLNPNIRVFSTTFNFLWMNRNWLKKSNISFERLELEVNYLLERNAENVCGLVSELYKKGFYKRLHFYGTIIHDEDMNRIILLPELEKMNIRYSDTSQEGIPSSLISLKELSFMDQYDFRDLNTLASNLVNVDRIHISKTTIDGILPFVRRSSKLMKIRVNCLSGVNETYFKDGAIDVQALNNERIQLPAACILTIYVAESIFLRTKRTMAVTECSLVQLKRTHAYEWTHQFHREESLE